jgi:hypothetical protein
MKSLLSILALLFFGATWAADTAAALDMSLLRGEVLEFKNVGNYTYLRLKTSDGETWAAVAKAAVTAGEQVTIEDSSVMEDFESKALGRTFDRIVFGVLGGASSGGSMAGSAGGAETTPADAKVAKASGPAARTVEEIVRQSADLKDQTVVVRGRVVKYNAAVMGTNWIHLRDGSGSASDNSNDVLVTTQGQAGLGDVVTAKGLVRTDKDFGAGYSYKVLVEDAILQK